jgi:hypothetical protein
MRYEDGCRKREMNDDDLKVKIRESLGRVTAPPFALEDVARRARRFRVRRMLASGLAVAVVAAGIGIPLWALSSVGGKQNPRPGSASTLDRFGISITLPESWDGRLTLRGLEAASSPLPSDPSSFPSEARNTMGLQDATMYLTELTSICPCGNGFRHVELPFQMPASEFAADGFEGVPADHAFGRKMFVTNGRWFDLWVEFGSTPPPADRLDQVNAALATLQISAQSGWTTHTDQNDHVSISTPDGWTFKEDPIPSLAEPKILFATGTWPFPPGGDCGPTVAVDSIPPDGAYLWLLEYRRPENFGDFPPRQASFSFGEPATYECSGSRPSYLVRFMDGWRYFQFQVALGDAATEKIRQDVIDIVNSFSVEASPEEETLPRWLYICDRVGFVRCPFADWIRDAVWDAGFTVRGATETAIDVGTDGHTFLMWTTSPKPVPPGPGYAASTVDGVTVYGNGTREVWAVRGIDVWVDSGQRSGDSFPTQSDLEGLVRWTTKERIA